MSCALNQANKTKIANKKWITHTTVDHAYLGSFVHHLFAVYSFYNWHLVLSCQLERMCIVQKSIHLIPVYL